MNNTRNFLYSYTNFIKERNNFRIVDTEGVNRYDSPAALYYKIVFYFSDNGGLLGIDSILSSDNNTNIKKTISEMTASFKDKDEGNSDNTPKNIDTNTFKNSAYNFLLMNDELERAELLKQFIILLSNISSESPWYFQEIGGLDAALERKVFSDGEMKLEDSKKQITIKCLPDAYDNRIGTLLDLYRAACFSYQNKKEIVPANLRKFNMGILLFNAPIRCKSGKASGEDVKITIPSKNNEGHYIPSAKLIELRNCEFDYNSAKSAFGTLNTTEDPLDPEYTITINFDECYESRYNEIMNYIVADFINIDLNAERNGDSLSDIIFTNKDVENRIVKDVNKAYWTDTQDLRLNPVQDRLYIGGATGKMEFRNIENTIGSAFGPNVLKSQFNSVSDKVKEAIKLPSIKDENIKNIHNTGTVNQIGEFEYLNHISGNNGIVGSVATQAVGALTNPFIEKAKSIYLGNIRSQSVSNMINMTEKALSGNVNGVINSLKKYETQPEQKLENKNLFSSPSYEYNINTAKGKINKAKSARNNI